MDYPQLGARVTRGHGHQVANGYTVQLETVDTSYVRRMGDDDMAETFDLVGYYGDDQTNTRITKKRLELAANVNSPKRDQPLKSQTPEGDEDGCREMFESALVNFYSNDPMKSPLIQLEASCFDADFIEPPGAVNLAQLVAITRIEKWDVDKTTMEFLTSVMALSTPCDTLGANCGLRPHVRDFKLEEPVLSSDAATDMLRLRQRNIVCLTPSGMKPFPSEKRCDQDLQWSTRSLRLPHDMEKLIAAEKMIVNGETGSLLREMYEDMSGDVLALISKDHQYKPRLRPVTPPLLPLSSPYSPGSVPSVAARLPFTSTPENALLREARVLDLQMMEAENFEEILADGSQLNEYSPLKHVAKSSSSPLRRKFDKISDLKLSSPLLLVVEQSEPLAKKCKGVCFAEELQTLIPQLDSDDISTDPRVAADQALAAVSAMIEPEVQATMEQASNDQLVELDTTASVDVPPIEDIDPEAPWAIYCGRHHALLADSRAGILMSDRRWSGASSLERLLPWSPFSAHLGKLKPEGDFDDGSLARYLSELDIEENVDVRQMMWKSDDLRILDDLDNEDDLAVCNYEHIDTAQDHNYPNHGAQIAKMVSHEPTKTFRPPPSQPPLDTKSSKSAVMAMESFSAQLKSCPQHSHSTVPTSVVPEVNSMQALLEKRRVQLQREKATLDANHLSTTQSGIHAESDQVLVGKKLETSVKQGHLYTFMAVQGVRGNPRKEVRKAQQAEAKVESPLALPLTTLAKPKLEIPAPRTNVWKSRLPIVVLSTLMANRQLIRKLQHRLPKLDLIERESLIPIGKQIDTSSFTREADLTLSPSTGLMYTTLQKLKQRPLPGQEASFVGIRDQFIRVAPRYERLIILFSEGSHSTSEAQTHIRTLDERDSTAIADFIGGCSRLDTDVQVSYIPGGEDELVKWIAAAVTRWAPCIEGFVLLEEQTVWESFLRIAGLNVFAAQVVLDRLKPSSSQLDGGESTMLCSSEFERYGLAAFVRMNVEERIEQFGPLLGGERMLRRVSMALDGPWNSETKRR